MPKTVETFADTDSRADNLRVEVLVDGSVSLRMGHDAAHWFIANEVEAKRLASFLSILNK